MVSEPSKEAMERAGAVVIIASAHEYCHYVGMGETSIVKLETLAGAEGVRAQLVEGIARAIDAAVMEERARKQPCGHPVACIVSTGEGANYCGWCEDVERQRSEAWEEGRNTPDNDIRHFRP